MTQAYKQRLLAWLRANGPSDTAKIKAEFPKAPLREMEQKDGSIRYRDDKWEVVT